MPPAPAALEDGALYGYGIAALRTTGAPFGRADCRIFHFDHAPVRGVRPAGGYARNVMKNFTISFLGRDCPGVVAAVSRTLGESGCNIMQLSQTILSGEFAAIYIVQAPDSLDPEALRRSLAVTLEAENMDMSVLVRPATGSAWGKGEPCQPFVVTADGPDHPGEIAAMSRVFARHNVNIESLKAVLGEGGSNHALFVFEVMVPDRVDLGRLRRELIKEGSMHNLRVGVQHRDIFEAMHRIVSV